MAGTVIDSFRSGATKIARCWLLQRHDGSHIGFSDHDRELEFNGHKFHADSGLTGAALERSLGLSVDNGEAIGALKHSALSEEDITAGRYDNATIYIWLVNWSDTAEYLMIFKGTLGEIERQNGEFRVEIRSQTEQLNQPRGRVIQKNCAAILGDKACGIDLTAKAYHWETKISAVSEARIFTFLETGGYADGTFSQGRMRFLEGAAEGLEYLIAQDSVLGGARHLTLSESVRAEIKSGDKIRLSVGCDKTAKTCKSKFNNFYNFRGFSHLPGRDWMFVYPKQGNVFDGGKLVR